MEDKNGDKILDFNEEKKPIIGYDDNGQEKLGEVDMTENNDPIIGYTADKKPVIGFEKSG